MKKLVVLIAFSVLLLIPVGVSESFADHPDEYECPDMLETFAPGSFDVYPGILLTEGFYAESRFGVFGGNPPFCFVGMDALTFFECSSPYAMTELFLDEARTQQIALDSVSLCVAEPIPVSHVTLAEQCQGASILVDNHCFSQALGSMVGGAWLDINTVSMLVGAIGVNPVITGLVAIAMGGVAAQAVWYFNSKRLRKSNKIILVAFSILLLIPVGVQESFADHPDELGCPDMDGGFGDIFTGIPVSDRHTGFVYESSLFGSLVFCFTFTDGNICYSPYLRDAMFHRNVFADVIGGCILTTFPHILVPHITLASQCEGAAVLIDNHCFAEAIGMAVGGELIEVDRVSLLVGAIGVNPVITGIFAITFGGIAGQVAWFIHKRKKNSLLSKN